MLVSRHPDLIASAGLVILVLVFFYKIWWGLVPIPADIIVGGYYPWVDSEIRIPIKNPLLSDAVSLVYPLRTYAWKLARSGQLPLWNDKVFGGYPIIGSLPTGLYFPTSLFYLGLPDSVAWTGQILAQTLIALFGMYFLVRSLKLNQVSAFFSSIVYGFGGFSLIYLEWNVHSAASALLPWIIWCLHQFLQTNKLKWGVGLAVALTLQIFAGYPPVTLFSILAIGIWSIFYAQIWWFTSQRVLLFLLLGIVMAGIQLLPAAELYQHSQRLFEVIDKNEIFVPFQYLISLIAPDYFGNPATGNFYGQGNYLNVAGYSGVVTLILAVIGISNQKIAAKTRPLMIILGLVLMIATPNPVANLEYNLGFWGGNSMTMNRSLFLINFGLAILAGYGISSLSQLTFKKVGLLIGFFGVILIGLFTYSLRMHQNVSLRNLILPSLMVIATLGSITAGLIFKRSKVMALMLVILVAAELFYFGWKFTPFTPSSYLYPPTQLTDFLQIHANDRFVSELDAIPPNMWLPYNLQSISGYDSYYPVGIAKTLAVINSGRLDATPQTKSGVINHFGSPLLDQAGIKYFVSLKRDLNNSIKADGQTPKVFDDPKFKSVFDHQSVVVFENSLAKPRAYLQSNSQPQELQLLTNYHQRILLNEAGYDRLIMLDPVYPGWQAQIDGTPVAIDHYLSNFRSIKLAKSAKVVDLYYQPLSLWLGVILSLIGVLISILIIRLDRRG